LVVRKRIDQPGFSEGSRDVPTRIISDRVERRCIPGAPADYAALVDDLADLLIAVRDVRRRATSESGAHTTAVTLPPSGRGA